MCSLSILSDCYHECRQPEGFSNIFALFFYPVSCWLPNDSVEQCVIIISGFLMFSLRLYSDNHIYTAFPAPRKPPPFFLETCANGISDLPYCIIVL